MASGWWGTLCLSRLLWVVLALWVVWVQVAAAVLRLQHLCRAAARCLAGGGLLLLWPLRRRPVAGSGRGCFLLQQLVPGMPGQRPAQSAVEGGGAHETDLLRASMC